VLGLQDAHHLLHDLGVGFHIAGVGGARQQVEEPRLRGAADGFEPVAASSSVTPPRPASNSVRSSRTSEKGLQQRREGLVGFGRRQAARAGKDLPQSHQGLHRAERVGAQHGILDAGDLIGVSMN
jgi:hypothetical protein